MHPTLDYAIPQENSIKFSKDLAVFNVRFNAVVGLIESYLEKTPYDYGLQVVSFPSLFICYPLWWQEANRFDYHFGEHSGGVAVHMVRNFWINSFLCTSHPAKKLMLLP